MHKLCFFCVFFCLQKEGLYPRICFQKVIDSSFCLFVLFFEVFYVEWMSRIQYEDQLGGRYFIPSICKR